MSQMHATMESMWRWLKMVFAIEALAEWEDQLVPKSVLQWRSALLCFSFHVPDNGYSVVPSPHLIPIRFHPIFVVSFPFQRRAHQPANEFQSLQIFRNILFIKNWENCKLLIEIKEEEEEEKLKILLTQFFLFINLSNILSSFPLLLLICLTLFGIEKSCTSFIMSLVGSVAGLGYLKCSETLEMKNCKFIITSSKILRAKRDVYIVYYWRKFQTF